MAEIIDFKVEKKRILKKWEAEIEVDIKAQDWYIEAFGMGKLACICIETGEFVFSI